ncbi:MAG: 3-dehydroquinate synthase [Victivallales bacterium]
MLSVKINVEYDYKVHFTRNVFSGGNPLLKKVIASREGRRRHDMVFAIEHGVLKLHPSISKDILRYCRKHDGSIRLACEPIVKFGGEDWKSFEVISEFCRAMGENHLCRQSFICIVGGGAFLDTVGFAASIVHRGIRQIRMPTTVLAQDDSGVGVKNGINMFGMKNFIGTFAPPFAVINDFNFLDTLEQRDWVSGVAEALKVSMIKDSRFFDWICRNTEKLRRRDGPVMEKLVKRCAELHVMHIQTSGDPFEFGSARPLDFGHWSAHKLEMMSGGKIRHGEAVAVGLALDSYYAVEKGLLYKGDFERLLSCLKILGLAPWSDYLLEKDKNGNSRIFSGIREFREHLGGELHITLPNGLGRKTEVNELDEKILLDGIGHLKEINKR